MTVSALVIIPLLICSGCSVNSDDNQQNDNEEAIIYEEQQTINADSEKLAEGYRAIYEKARKEDTLDTLELQQEIIEYFGNAGYAAVDIDNQINMVQYEQVEEFCEKAEKEQEGELKLFSVMGGGGFVRYDMQTKQGKIDIIVSTVEWEDGNPQSVYYHEFEAYTWKYTEKGYFFIEEYHPPGFDGAPGQKGFRVKPLDNFCRELNRKYVIPVGYALNNMLIVDWSEQDFTNLNFYDLYELLYQLKYDDYVPYQADYGAAEYEVPKSDFEEVIQTYFQIDSADIENNTVYDPDRLTYRYRPRGLYDCEFPYGPYPEVVGYEKQDDGTLKLFIEAVWERKEQDHAISSELVARPLENGRFQYVSNKVIRFEGDEQGGWYMPRLTDEEWKEYYGETQ
ncbi:DUF6070 family protein [Anaerostipes caccae]|uniref:DUF6070 family protein n=1 Tax=Anaerostipes caccae TaxID=105841 RepID=UPI002672EA66|nr:DUF6070 family protein [Anaerostipes caccae]